MSDDGPRVALGDVERTSENVAVYARLVADLLARGLDASKRCCWASTTAKHYPKRSGRITAQDRRVHQPCGVDNRELASHPPGGSSAGSTARWHCASPPQGCPPPSNPSAASRASGRGVPRLLTTLQGATADQPGTDSHVHRVTGLTLRCTDTRRSPTQIQRLPRHPPSTVRHDHPAAVMYRARPHPRPRTPDPHPHLADPARHRPHVERQG